jgi:hypothetical protein
MEVRREVKTSEVLAVICHQPVSGQIGFAYHDPLAVFVGHTSHRGNRSVNLGLIGGLNTKEAPRRRHSFAPLCICRIVPKLLVFEQVVNGIDAKTIHAACQPEPQNIEHRGTHGGISPVQVGLLVEIGMIVVLAGPWI